MNSCLRHRPGSKTRFAPWVLSLCVARAAFAETPPAPEPDAGDELAFEGVAEVEAPPSEPTKRTLETEQATTIPGTRGDALRAVEVLPGVGRTPFGTNPGPPPLRGSSPSESLILLDGASMPLLFHFGGLTSVFNSHLLESVTLYPGNFSARYGRAAGGVVDVRVRSPKADRFHLLLELSAIDSSVLVEGPLGERTSIALAARRSNIDFFFDALITEESTAVLAAPVYWDYQAIVAHRFDDRHEVRLLAYGGHDAFELEFGEAVPDDPALYGDFGGALAFHRVQLELESRFSDAVTQALMLSLGPSPGEGRFGSVEYEYSSWEGSARGDWSIVAAPWLRLDAGFDVLVTSAEAFYEGPPPPPEDGAPLQGSLASTSGGRIDADLTIVRPGAYVEASLRPRREILLVPGVRIDYAGDADAWMVNPRLASRVDVLDSTTLKAGAGYYSQPPQYWEVLETFGNPELDPFRTLQFSAGAEQRFGKVLRGDIDGFYKHWDDRIVGTPGGAAPYWVNGGEGDAYGVELLLDLALTQKTRALLAYTLSRSVRKDGPDQATRPFDEDQTHHLSFAANYDLGKNWLAGARFRYVTGSPYSAVAGAVYDASSDTYRPLYGPINEARNPAFHQLDLRIEKLWKIGPVDLTTYLEVMNVYNRENEEGRRYSFDYRESAPVLGTPIFPNLGIRGEL